MVVFTLGVFSNPILCYVKDNGLNKNERVDILLCQSPGRLSESPVGKFNQDGSFHNNLICSL